MARKDSAIGHLHQHTETHRVLTFVVNLHIERLRSDVETTAFSVGQSSP